MEKKITKHSAMFPSFLKATSAGRKYSLRVQANIELLLKGIEIYPTKASINTPKAEADIKNKFEEFLTGCEFHMAHIDFEKTLQESKDRDDGSIGWYHQLSQVRQFLYLVKNKVISLQDLEEYGGLETAIRTALRHDSIEDFGTSFEDFEKEEAESTKICLLDLKKKGYDNIDEEKWIKKEDQNLEILMQNMRLITKKISILDPNEEPQYNEDGSRIKKDLFPNTRAYIHNMVDSENASPVVWILKVFDGTHNLSSMIDAPKFTAPRRLKYANEREDMYGARQGLPEQAMEKWPEFSDAIRKADDFMGSVLYLNFGYLEYVDQESAYPNADSGKHRDGDKIPLSGIGKFLKEAISIDTPCGLSPLHNLLDAIKEKSQKNGNVKTKMRATLFWNQSIKPVLEPYADIFPQINTNHQQTKSHPNNKLTP